MHQNNLGINLTKKLKGLYTVNYKILIIEAEYKGKVICNHWLEELILLKCPYYLKQCTYPMWSLSQF